MDNNCNSEIFPLKSDCVRTEQIAALITTTPHIYCN